MNLEYDQISPITNNKCVLVEADEKTNSESYLCMESGYTSSDKLQIGSSDIFNYEASITELMKKEKFIDEERNLIWYPAFMPVPGAMLYCEGESENWQWKVARVVQITGAERIHYPVVGKEGEYHTSRLDVDNAKVYNKLDFESALNELYNIVGEQNED